MRADFTQSLSLPAHLIKPTVSLLAKVTRAWGGRCIQVLVMNDSILEGRRRENCSENDRSTSPLPVGKKEQ